MILSFMETSEKKKSPDIRALFCELAKLPSDTEITRECITEHFEAFKHIQLMHGYPAESLLAILVKN